MRINYNVTAMLSNNALANSDSLLAKSMERLSSGLKINQAKDNPAGLAMAKRMNAQLEGLSVANQNASDGVSVIEIADGAMTEITAMLQRLNELSVKAANGILVEDDRAMIQAEVAQLKEEITRVSETTEFNGQKLLNGEFDLRGYTNEIDIKVQTYSSEVPAKMYTITDLSLSKVTAADGTLTKLRVAFFNCSSFTPATIIGTSLSLKKLVVQSITFAPLAKALPTNLLEISSLLAKRAKSMPEKSKVSRLCTSISSSSP